MSFTSYAEFFGSHPEALISIRRQYGRRVYTDDNVICDPSKEEQAVAVCHLAETLTGYLLLVYDLPADADDEPAVEINIHLH